MPVRIFLGAPEELSDYPPSFSPTISISHAPTFLLLYLLLSSQNPSLPLSAYLILSPLPAKGLLLALSFQLYMLLVPDISPS